MNVRTVIEIEFLNKLVPDGMNRFQIVQTERIGGPHCGDDGRYLPALLQHVSQQRFQQVGSNLVFVCRGHLKDVLFSQPQPVGNTHTGVMRAVGTQDDCRFTNACLSRSRTGLFETNFDSIQQRSGSTEREHPPARSES